MADKRDIITSPRMIELSRKKRKRRNIILIVIFILFIGLIVGLSYLSSYSKLVISDIKVEGTHIIDQDSVKELVEKDLSGNYLRLFKKANTFIYPSGKIHSDIMKNFPRTDKLEIKRVGFRGLSINITERSGSYLWCGSDIPKETSKIGDDCYFLNTDGYIFDKAPYFSGDVYFKFYVSLGEGVAPLGAKVLPPEIFKPMINFIDNVTSLGLHPVSLVMSDEIQYELYLAHTTTSNPKILFNKESDLPTIFTNLSAAYSKPEFKKEVIDKYSTLNYIDLRFKNKVLYKFNE
jgi:hypothetical protein